jgi:hypothetical protein
LRSSYRTGCRAADITSERPKLGSNLDARRDDVLPILATFYGTDAARRWLNRWRMFFLAVAELFGFAGGHDWFVSHYVLEHVAHSKPNGTHTH